MNLNYYLNEIKKANQLLIKIFDYLYKLNNKKLNKTIYFHVFLRILNY